MGERMSDQFPVLLGRRKRTVDYQKVDEVRRALWRAFQQGRLSEDELASTLDRLEFLPECRSQPAFDFDALSQKERLGCHTPTVP
jgi:hypothetical protein